MTYEMLPADPFGDVPIFAELPAAEQQDLLRDHGGAAGAGTSPPPRVMRGINLNPFAARPFGIRDVTVGHVSAGAGGDDLPIVHAATVEGDPDLAHQPLTVSLDRFYVQEYPGLGPHQVLCTFTIGCLAKFDPQSGQPIKQDVTFGYSFSVGDREAAGINGMPLFRDLRISDGLYMWISCINTHSSGDDALLEVLAGDPFSKGLGLLAITNPVTTMLSSLVTGVAKHFLNSSRDALVFKPLLGLQVAGETTSGKLRAGSYVIAQAGAGDFQWADYTWKHSEGRVVGGDTGEELPFNYIVISVRRQPGAS
jgi:hypothetical protein